MSTTPDVKSRFSLGGWIKKPALPALFKRKQPDKQAITAPDTTAPEAENPYLAARRTWNEHIGSVVSSRQTWQVVGILSLLIALAAVGGIIHIGSQSKFIPYVVEIDKLGEIVNTQPVQQAAPVDPRIIRASLATFINDARLVTPDVALQRKAVFQVYAMLAPQDPATAKMNEWLNGTEESSPFRRAARETVDIKITSILPVTSETWQVDWEETTRDRQGRPKSKPVHWRALLTVRFIKPTSATTEEQIRRNPLGLYVRDFSWTKKNL